MVRFESVVKKALIIGATLGLIDCCHAWTSSSLKSRYNTKFQVKKNILKTSSSSLTREGQQRRQLSLFLCMKEDDDENENEIVVDFPRLMLFNSKLREKRVFETLEKGKVKMYTCGPTIYDFAHVGNFRAFLTYDLLKRVLLYFGWDVDHVCNLTDVDDKILARCKERGETLETLTDRYEKAFMDDLNSLNIIPANRYPRATHHINDMIELIQILSDKGLAYQTKDQSWYFSTQQDTDYGTRLIDLNVDEMQSQERTSTSDDDQKHHVRDFCLWKSTTSEDDFCVWDTPLGKGRPGWHLECSAMARVYLGDTIDVHCGGIDLKFPHHENEMAQSMCATGSTFCDCWVHNGFVNIGNEKMSKSKGNFLTLSQACPSRRAVRAYRYLVLSSQYRNPLTFTDRAIKASMNALDRIDKVRDQLELIIKENEQQQQDSELASVLVPAQVQNFEAALLDDLCMPRAAASLFTLVKLAEGQLKQATTTTNDEEESIMDYSKLDIRGLRAIQDALTKMDRVFGIFYEVPLSEEQKEQEAEKEKDLIVPPNVQVLVSERTLAKQDKDWDRADRLRDEITALGWTIKDVKGGGAPILTRIEEQM